MAKTESELSVIVKAKDLCGYIMTITQRSPKQFRFTYVSRLQNAALTTIELAETVPIDDGFSRSLLLAWLYALKE